MSPKKQTFSNHRQFVPLYHFLTFGALLVLLVGSIWYLYKDNNVSQLFPWLFFILILTIISISIHGRSFALRAQDRAIRAEENFRYFILTGKRLDQRVTMKQIIALRFASDEELQELTEKAIRENMTYRDIKKSIKNWRPDHHRA